MVHKHKSVLMLVVVLVMIFILQSANVNAENGEHMLIYEGTDYSIRISFTKEADISENAFLNVNEIYEGSKEYQTYFSQTEDVVNIYFARFFDISIIDGETEIEPDEKVKVSISYKDGISKPSEKEIGVIHFVEDGSKELIEVNEEGKEHEETKEVTQVSFEQESFSVIGMIIFDGVDTDIKNVSSELITGVNVVNVEKRWSDGEDKHKEDYVTVSLYEEGEFSEEMILNKENMWSAAFDNLDEDRQYSIKEINAASENFDKTDMYSSEITNTSRKEWCPVDQNKMTDGENVLLTFYDGKNRLLRRSTNFYDGNLRVTDIEINSDKLGNYCETDVNVNYIWTTIWNEAKNAWELYSESEDAYLTLINNGGNYEWTTSRTKEEGSYLMYEDGIISASIGEVRKYLGNISGNGPYRGLEKDENGITEICLLSYQVYDPGKYIITNTLNKAVDSQEMNVDVITEKTIDYLGDKGDNPDTDVDNGNISEKILDDLYRMNLSMQMQTDVTGLDLLLVIDVSSSMKENRDSKDSEGNSIYRAEALRQALNQFVPEFLPKETKNRMSVVAFEDESVILNEWTKNADEILNKINAETEGDMPLYNGEGTNYESALARAHEALSLTGYSGNARAMIFLSDGSPTVYLQGNDDIEKGNVTLNLGKSEVTDAGIEGTYPEGIRAIWRTAHGGNDPIIAANEAIESFKKHNPEIMVGTIAFNTSVTECLRNMVTKPEFVTRIENGTPDDLINAMELITTYVPGKIILTDELSENVELYREKPDYKAVMKGTDGKVISLYEKDKLTDIGKTVLNNQSPIIVEDNCVKMIFKEDYKAKNDHLYTLSFNINVSQCAMNKYADANGRYAATGDEATDYKDNKTSSLKEGFYSNGERSKVTYFINGIVIEKKFRKPVIQTEKGTFTIKKVDLDNNKITSGAEFALYRLADENEVNTVKLKGAEGNYIKIREGVTNQNGELKFDDLRIAVFDKGYPYYLVETKNPKGYIRYEDPIELVLFKDKVEVEPENSWVDYENQIVVIKNAEYVEPIELPVTGGIGTLGFYVIGMVLIIGGYLCLAKNCFQRL